MPAFGPFFFISSFVQSFALSLNRHLFGSIHNVVAYGLLFEEELRLEKQN